MIADTTYVRDVGNLPDSLADKQMLPHLWASAKRLRGWVGDTVYDAVETLLEDELGDPRDFLDGFTTTDKALLERARNLASAEAYLAMAMGCASWNTVMDTGGAPSGISTQGVMGDTDSSPFLKLPEEVWKLQEG